MRVALVLNGEPPGPAELALARGCDAVVCADGGADAVLAAGITPGLVVGDFDSLSERGRALAEVRGVRLERLPEAKDETDGERALDAALAMRPRELLILGAHGRRSAMVLANLLLLRRAHDAAGASILGQGERLRFATAGQRRVLPMGREFSVLPWGPAVVSLRGTAYDVERLRLDATSCRGVSNRARERAELEVHEGCVLVVEEGAP